MIPHCMICMLMGSGWVIVAGDCVENVVLSAQLCAG